MCFEKVSWRFFLSPAGALAAQLISFAFTQFDWWECFLSNSIDVNVFLSVQRSESTGILLQVVNLNEWRCPIPTVVWPLLVLICGGGTPGAGTTVAFPDSRERVCPHSSITKDSSNVTVQAVALDWWLLHILCCISLINNNIAMLV